MEFIKEGSVLPIPFNIVPTPASMFEILKRVLFCFKPTVEKTIATDQPSYYASNKPQGKGGTPKVSIPRHHTFLMEQKFHYAFVVF